MLRTVLSVFLVLACARAGFGQTFGMTGGLGQTTGGLGQTTGGFGQTTGLGAASSASPFGQTGVGQAGLGGGFGATVALDPTFGATQLSSSLATAAAVSRATSAIGGRGGFGSGFGSGFGGRGGFGGFGGQNNNTQTPKIRAVLRIGFPIDARNDATLSQEVSDRFARMPLPKNLGNVQISMEGRTAVLRGQVAAEEDGKLAERLLSLEPGIDAVKNELTIAGQSSSSRSAPNVEVVPIPNASR